MAYIYIGKNTTKLSNMIGQQNKKNLRSLEKQLVLMAKVEDICVCCFFSSWKYSEAFVLFWYWGESTKNTGNLVLLCISPWYIPVRTPLFKLHSPLMASRLDKSCLEEGNSSKCFEQYTCICRLKHIDTCINIYIYAGIKEIRIWTNMGMDTYCIILQIWWCILYVHLNSTNRCI